MKNAFKNITNSIIVLSVFSIILGVLMIVFPGASLQAFGIAAAVFLIAQGIVLIVLDVKAWRLYIPFEGMLSGILSVIVGILFAIHPENFAIYVGVSVGLWIIVSGFSGIKLGYALRYTHAPWLWMILLNVLDIVLGALMIFSPIAASFGTMVAIGIILVYHAVNCLVNMLIIKKNAKEAEKLIKEKFAVIKEAVEAAQAAPAEETPTAE